MFPPARMVIYSSSSAKPWEDAEAALYHADTGITVSETATLHLAAVTYDGETITSYSKPLSLVYLIDEYELTSVRSEVTLNPNGTNYWAIDTTATGAGNYAFSFDMVSTGYSQTIHWGIYNASGEQVKYIMAARYYEDTEIHEVIYLAAGFYYLQIDWPGYSTCHPSMTKSLDAIPMISVDAGNYTRHKRSY